MTTFTDTSTPESQAAQLAAAQTPNGQIALVRMLMGRASDLLKLGASKSDVIGAFAGNLELFEFIAVSNDFSKELGEAMNLGHKAVDALADALFYNANGEVAFKPEGAKSIVITTRGGATMKARICDISIDAAGRLSAVWDMRHVLISNPRYFMAVPADSIGKIEYVR